MKLRYLKVFNGKNKDKSDILPLIVAQDWHEIEELSY